MVGVLLSNGPKASAAFASAAAAAFMPRLRTNGVNTNGAAAKVMNFDRLGKKVITPWYFWEDTNKLTGVPNTKFAVKKNNKQKTVAPLVPTPFGPFPTADGSHPAGPRGVAAVDGARHLIAINNSY